MLVSPSLNHLVLGSLGMFISSTRGHLLPVSGRVSLALCGGMMVVFACVDLKLTHNLTRSGSK